MLNNVITPERVANPQQQTGTDDNGNVSADDETADNGELHSYDLIKELLEIANTC